MEKVQFDLEFIDPTDALTAMAQMLGCGAGNCDKFDESGMIGASKILHSIVHDIHVICEDLNERMNTGRPDDLFPDDELLALLREATERGFDVKKLLKDGLQEGKA